MAGARFHWLAEPLAHKLALTQLNSTPFHSIPLNTDQPAAISRLRRCCCCCCCFCRLRFLRWRVACRLSRAGCSLAARPAHKARSHARGAAIGQPLRLSTVRCSLATHSLMPARPTLGERPLARLRTPRPGPVRLDRAHCASAAQSSQRIELASAQSVPQ